MTAAAADPRAQSFAANGFRLSEEQEEILSTSDRFAQAEFWPLQRRMDDEEWWPPEAMPAHVSHGAPPWRTWEMPDWICPPRPHSSE